jgi:putative colanic acid biosynthesis UDP-glucose lipid carrier transferase
MFILLMGLNILWFLSSNMINFYDELISRNFALQFINLVKNIVIQVIASVLFIFITKEDLFTRNFIFYYSVIFAFLIILRFIAFRKILKALRRQGKNIRSLAIIGSGHTSTDFYNVIKDHPDFGYKLAGFITDTDEVKPGQNILGSINRLTEILIDNKIDEVVIALSSGSPALLDNIINTCNRNAVKTHIIPDFARYMSKKFQVSMLGEFPVVTVRNEPLEEVQWRFIKRAFDIIFSLIVIIFVLSWFLPIAAVILKLQSPGPVFFIHDRIGVKNKKFKCYKIRTMYAGKGQSDRFRPASSGDPRITPIGRILRKTNIDELPQFFNVLKGDMSVVGPRPHTIPFNEKYSEIVDIIKMRHNVKPGITGWAQVHGLRGDSVDDAENTILIKKRIEYDLWYIENWSLWLDIQIIIMTVWRMLTGESKGL